MRAVGDAEGNGGAERLGPAATRARPRFFVSAATTYATSIAAAVAGLLNILITARFLGPTGRGEIALLITIASLTATIALLGVHQSIVNLAGREPALRATLATNAILLSGVLGAAAASALAGLIAVFPGLTGELASSLLAFVFLAVPFLIGRVYLQSLLHADYRFAFANGVRLLAPVSGIVVNGALGVIRLLSVGTAMAVGGGGQALASLLLALFVARRLAGFGRPSAAVARRCLSFGIKSHLGHVMNLSNARLDQWFVGTMAGSRELGLYNIAVAWMEPLILLPRALQTVQRPDLVRVDRGRASRQAAAVFRVGILITIPATLAIVAAAPLLCTVVFGEEFRGSVDDLRMLALGAFGIVALMLLGDALVAQRRPMLSTAAIAIALVCTIVLDVTLIPAHGSFGAAIASTVAFTAGGLGAILIFMRALRPPLRSLLPRPREDMRYLLQRARGRVRRPEPRTEQAPAPAPLMPRSQDVNSTMSQERTN